MFEDSIYFPGKLDQSPPIFPDRTTLQGLASAVETNVWPDIQELCGANPDVLRGNISAHARDIAVKMDTVRGYRDELLYLNQVYHALQTHDLPNNFYTLRDDMNSFSSFIAAFYEKNPFTPGQIRRFKAELYIVNGLTQPLDILFISKKSGTRKNFKQTVWRDPPHIHDEWIKVDENADRAIFVSQGVNAEYMRARESGRASFIEYDHATTSAALPGIARERALLSRDEVEKRGGQVVSGERSDLSPRVFVQEKFNYGIGYSNISWFDEFPVDIEISKDAPRERYAPEHGISLGTEVPIRFVKRIFTPFSHEPEVKKWVAANAPHASVLSLEAYIALQKGY